MPSYSYQTFGLDALEGADGGDVPSQGETWRIREDWTSDDAVRIDVSDDGGGQIFSGADASGDRSSDTDQQGTATQPGGGSDSGSMYLGFGARATDADGNAVTFYAVMIDGEAVAILADAPTQPGTEYTIGETFTVGGSNRPRYDNLQSQAHDPGDTGQNAGSNGGEPGGAGAETLRGTEGDDTLSGDGNDEALLGLGGDDVLDGGGGSDTLRGGDGHDTISGDDGDWLDGGAGDDWLWVGEGSGIRVEGGDGFDRLDIRNDETAENVEIVWTGDGAGRFAFGGDPATGGTFAGIEEFEATQLDDVIDARADGAGVIVDGEYGDDLIFGGSGDDHLGGREGDDTIEGGGGDDTLLGETGNDDLDGGAGHDTLLGGAGADRLSGGDGADRLEGGEGRDTLDGGAGDDHLDGGTGDLLHGGAGDDTIWVIGQGGDGLHVDGGSGYDKLDTWNKAATEAVQIEFTGTGAGRFAYGGDPATGGTFEGIEEVEGTQFDDVIDATGDGGGLVSDGEGGDDTMLGGAGDDDLDGEAGDDSLAGGAGDDTIRGGDGGDRVSGGDGADRLEGGEGRDTLDGGAGDDRLDGGSGDDVLDGGSGDDALEGGDGDDRLSGGAGADTLVGGAGADTFVAGAADAGDVIADLDTKGMDDDGRFADRLDVSALRTPEGAPVRTWHVNVEDDGSGNARLLFPEGESVTLAGVAPDEIDDGPSLFAAGIPCFTAGTLIDTPAGPRLVEALRPGDLILTADDGPQPLAWSAQRHLGARDLAKAPRLRPVIIEAGAYGNDRALAVSPQHALSVRMPGPGSTPSLVRATHLARAAGGRVRVARGRRSVTYVHLFFERHQLVRAHGLWSESFYPGPWALRGLDRAARRELLDLMPSLGAVAPGAAYGGTARAPLGRRDLPPRQSELRMVA